MLLLVPAYPGSPGQKAVKWLCACVWLTNVSSSIRHRCRFYGMQFRLCLLLICTVADAVVSESSCDVLGNIALPSMSYQQAVSYFVYCF